MSYNILVTGGAGFIGSNLVKKLELENYKVKVIDNLSKGSFNYLENPRILQKGDIRDVDFLKKTMRDIDVVIHLAAYGSVVESVSDPMTNFDINVCGTYNILDVARKSKVKKFIFASTGGAIIGNHLPPVDENSLPKPISPYGSSKLSGEAYCHSFAKVYGLETVCLRFAIIYGPHSAHKAGAVSKFMKCLLENKPIQIFGDGLNTRDYLYIDDLIQGILKTLKKNLNPGSIYHLASGIEEKTIDLAKMIIRIASKSNYPIEFLDKRVGEIERNFAKYDKAFKELKFIPTINLEAGLETTWNWYKDNI